jgi:hypothetical protein
LKQRSAASQDFNADEPCGSLNEYTMGGNTWNIDIEHKYEAEAERLKDNSNKVLKLVSTNKDYSMKNIKKKTNNKLQKIITMLNYQLYW